MSPFGFELSRTTIRVVGRSGQYTDSDQVHVVTMAPRMAELATVFTPRAVLEMPAWRFGQSLNVAIHAAPDAVC
jgi:hypothetical protein